MKPSRRERGVATRPKCRDETETVETRRRDETVVSRRDRGVETRPRLHNVNSVIVLSDHD